MKLKKDRIAKFRKIIFDWWQTHRRDLPWRRTHDPYKIFVSEVMLQQTQVLRVIPKYVEFTETYPTASSLAKAPVADVLRIWKGMGYNRRALYLKRAAEAVVNDYGGRFPKSEKELRKLPGLGTYTAAAILVFAYGENVALVDTNIRQIITHFFFHDKKQKEKIIQEVADALVPAGKSWEWHQALMDYGALELKKVPGAVKKQKPFKDSDRFYRGRIIDRLREGNVRDFILLKELQHAYDKPEDDLLRIVESLIKDGLVEREKGTLQLPG